MPFINAETMLQAAPLPGWRGRFFHSDNVTIATYDIDADAVPIHEHYHEQEEVWNVTAGRIVVSIDGAEAVLGPGDAAVVPANMPHHARALMASRAVVVDYPLRLQLPGQAHDG